MTCADEIEFYLISVALFFPYTFLNHYNLDNYAAIRQAYHVWTM